MNEEMAAKLHTELVEIRDILTRLQDRVEQLISQLEKEMKSSSPYTLSSIIGLGASSSPDDTFAGKP